MSELQVEGMALKKLLKLAKKNPLPFGFNPSTKIPECYLAMHRKKAAKIIGKDAKEEGPGEKSAFGTIKIDGKLLIVNCERIVPNLAKTLKKYLKLQKVMLNVEVRDANGSVLEADVEEGLPDDPELEGEDEDVGLDKAALAKRLAELRKRIQTLDPKMAEKFNASYAKVVGMFKKDELEKCTKGADQIEAALPKPNAKPALDPTLAKLVEIYKKLREQAKSIGDEGNRSNIEKALAQAASHLKAQKAPEAKALLTKISDALKKAAQAGGKPNDPTPKPPNEAPLTGQDTKDFDAWTKVQKELSDKIVNAMTKGLVANVDALRKNWNWAVSNAADKKYGEALKPVPNIRKMLATGTADGKSVFHDNIPPDAKPFAESRVRWSFARSKMLSEMQKIQSSIIEAVRDDEDLSKQVKANVGILTKKLEKLDSRLEDKLDEIVNEKVSAKRDGFKGQARKLISEYYAELESDFFQDIDSNSGFGDVAVLATAQKALSAIENVLN